MKAAKTARIVTIGMALYAGVACAQQAGTVDLRGDFGGSWYDPQQPGQGVQVDVLDGGRALVAWYTFDAEGRALWLSGLGRVEGDTIEVTLQRSTGGRFPGTGTQATTQEPWGALTLTFDGCDSGAMAWTPTAGGFAPGSAPLARLTSAQGARCDSEAAFGRQVVYSFETGMEGFTAVFADLPTTGQDIYELDYGHAPVQAPLQARHGVFLQGHNRSDDLAMLVKAPVRGLRPNALYAVELEAELASNVPSGCLGIGGSPGESVFVKLGAGAREPVAEAADGMLRLNIDYGVQGGSGEDALVVGDLALDTRECTGDAPEAWELKTLSTEGMPFDARTDADGTLWVYAGTDSGFEGLTTYYLTSMRVRLQPAAE